MRRRRFLAVSTGCLASLAGCSGGPDGDQPEDSTGDEDPDTPTPGDGTPDGAPADDTPADGTPTATPPDYDVDATFDALQPGIVTPNSPDSIGVRPDEGQYLYFAVAAGGDDLPARDDFAFAFDGEEHSPMDVDGGWEDTPWRFRSEAVYGGESGRVATDGLLLFELPERGDATGSALRWPGGEWTPGDTVRGRLSTPTPPFDVSLEAPDRIAQGEQPWLRVTVRNPGDVTGGFVAALNRTGPRIAYAPVARASLAVPAGGRETWEWEGEGIDTAAEGADSLDLKLRWHDGDSSHTVAIAPDE